MLEKQEKKNESPTLSRKFLKGSFVRIECSLTPRETNIAIVPFFADMHTFECVGGLQQLKIEQLVSFEQLGATFFYGATDRQQKCVLCTFGSNNIAGNVLLDHN